MSDTIRVLHVDGRPAFAELTATRLEAECDRITVETASDAGEGLERLAAVDCVVSDYGLPATTGIEFLERVRDRRPDLPFVLFTGSGSEAVASAAISAGVTDYVETEGGTSQFAVLANRIANAVDQYRSERELAASRRRLSLFFDQSPLGVIEWDEEFTVVRVNDAAAEILGYDEATLVGSSWERIVPDDTDAAVADTVEALLADRGGYRSVNENVRGDGQRICCEWHNRVVTDADGAVVAVFSQFQDVTERERRAERLRESTARLEALFENSPDMINVHDTDGTILDPNPRLCEETGYDAATLTGMKVWELDRSIDPDEARAVWREMSVGDRHRLEGEYERRDGTTFPVEIHLRRLDLDGEEQFVVISRDVSERRERERALQATTERLDTVVSNVPVVLFALDATGTVTLSEGQGLTALDLDPEEAVGESVFDLYADQPDVTEAVARALDGETVSATSEVSGRSFDTAYQPLVDDDGSVEGVIGVSMDVTGRRCRERKLARQNERLEEFVGVVSHDLRTPLNVADGRLALAAEDCDSDHLSETRAALDRMDQLIDDLLDIASADDRAVDVEPVSLADAVQAAWQTVETEGAALVVETTGTIRADPRRVRQLLANLLQNAVEHGSTSPHSDAREDAVEHGTDSGPDDGPTVTVGDLPDRAGFYVADDGPGIPPERRDAVFRSGYSTGDDGTGFGLAIVETAVDAHDWAIEVGESARGGARFEITGVDVVD
jgi:PAS domain S-box-containing protein